MIRPLRAIVLEARLDASPADVWHALTDAEALADWFPRKASAEKGVGGIVTLAWDDSQAWPTTIDVWEPERHLRWVDSLPPGPDGQPQPRLFLDWFISTENGQTVLRLVHSGFGTDANWDDQIDGLTGGWTYFLWNLEQILLHHRGRHRTMAWTRQRVDGTREALWDAMFETGMLSTAPGEATAGAECKLSFGSVSATGIIASCDRPNHFSARFPSLADSLFFVELEGKAPSGFHTGFWLSTYALDAGRVEELQQGLNNAVTECIARTTPVGQA